MSPAERELVRLRTRMKKWPIIVLGIWTICALYWVMAMMILDTADWNISTASGHQIAPWMLISCLMVAVTCFALTRNLLGMIPRKRLGKDHLWPREGWVSDRSSNESNHFDEMSWEELIREMHTPKEAPPPTAFEDNAYHR